MKNRLSTQNILFYLSWTIMYTIILLVVVRSEVLTVGKILVAFIISAILGVPSTNSFLKSLNRSAIDIDDLNLGLLPGEKIISKANATLKKGVIRLGGILYLTDRHILFIGTEFFDRNKKILCVPLSLIVDRKLDDNYQLRIRVESGKECIFALVGAFNFLSALNSALK